MFGMCVCVCVRVDLNANLTLGGMYLNTWFQAAGAGKVVL